MRLFEFQAKELFSDFSIPIPSGSVVESPPQITKALSRFKKRPCVVKAQVLAGGRGKAGGVVVAQTAPEAREAIKKLLGKKLVTRQTGKSGETIRRILVEQALTIEKEFYTAILVDRSREYPVLLASKEGGMEIEELAAKSPEKIIREPFNPNIGLRPYQARKVIFALGIRDPQLIQQGVAFLSNLSKAFLGLDATLAEVNPLGLTKEKGLVALDAKLTIDESALGRQPNAARFYDPSNEHPLEAKAKKVGINYVGLDGNIGCMVNGAGLAMATMDIIKLHGGQPANFLDVGGGASVEQVREAFRLLVSDKKVKAILINIFGGIMRCDVIAQGVIEAAKATRLDVPLVVRLEGTRVKEGRIILEKSKIDIVTATDMDDAAKKAVEVAG
mgnify:CR=1 FL=1